MPKSKINKDKQADDISELLELASELNLPSGSFNGDVLDELETQASDRAKEINELLIDQLEFLYDSGMSRERIEELIRQYAEEDS